MYARLQRPSFGLEDLLTPLNQPEIEGDAGRSRTEPPSLTLDLANSLPVQMPGRPPWAEQLGTLSLAYYEGEGDDKTYTTFVESIDYADPAFIDERAGMLVIGGHRITASRTPSAAPRSTCSPCSPSSGRRNRRGGGA